MNMNVNTSITISQNFNVNMNMGMSISMNTNINLKIHSNRKMYIHIHTYIERDIYAYIHCIAYVTYSIQCMSQPSASQASPFLHSFGKAGDQISNLRALGPKGALQPHSRGFHFGTPKTTFLIPSRSSWRRL